MCIMCQFACVEYKSGSKHQKTSAAEAEEIRRVCVFKVESPRRDSQMCRMGLECTQLHSQERDKIFYACVILYICDFFFFSPHFILCKCWVFFWESPFSASFSCIFYLFSCSEHHSGLCACARHWPLSSARSHRDLFLSTPSCRNLLVGRGAQKSVKDGVAGHSSGLPRAFRILNLRGKCLQCLFPVLAKTDCISFKGVLPAAFFLSPWILVVMF